MNNVNIQSNLKIIQKNSTSCIFHLFYKNYYIHADLIKKKFIHLEWIFDILLSGFKIRNNNQSLNSVVIDLQIIVKKISISSILVLISYFLIENIIITSEKLFFYKFV